MNVIIIRKGIEALTRLGIEYVSSYPDSRFAPFQTLEQTGRFFQAFFTRGE